MAWGVGRMSGEDNKDDGKSDGEVEHCLTTPFSALPRRPRETPA